MQHLPRQLCSSRIVGVPPPSLALTSSYVIFSLFFINRTGCCLLGATAVRTSFSPEVSPSLDRALSEGLISIYIQFSMPANAISAGH